ncbi:MAG: DUF4163 domain-containing protein [Deltaproteobacteria bacterium]|jgi:hypothetical protein|nr:DUF4163 domain-containing protein [Deltaproteobacteria bacterium]
MKKNAFAKILILALTLTAWLALSPHAIWAQDDDKSSGNDLPIDASHETDEAGNTYPTNGFDFLSAEVIAQDATLLKCPHFRLEIQVSYPSLTGDDKVDTLIRDNFTETFLEKKAEAVETLAKFECPKSSKDPEIYEIEVSFRAYSPSPGYLSVLYESFDGRVRLAHPSTDYHSSTYLIGQGREMTIKDLFADPKKSLPLFWAYIAPKWREVKKKDTNPFFYGEFPEEAPLPQRLEVADVALEALGNPVFTPDGLFLRLAADDGWSHADGPTTLIVPKEELLKMGANPKIWAATK